MAKALMLFYAAGNSGSGLRAVKQQGNKRTRQKTQDVNQINM